jgi:CheY-like chemotaxis protein
MPDKVLIIDDSLTNNVLLESLLQSVGIDSTLAYSGKEALKILKTEKPSLILLDIMMPDMDGFMVLDHINKNESTQNIPVIMITAKDDNESIMRAKNAGVKDFILKPIDIEKVLESVKKLLTVN